MQLEKVHVSAPSQATLSVATKMSTFLARSPRQLHRSYLRCLNSVRNRAFASQQTQSKMNDPLVVPISMESLFPSQAVMDFMDVSAKPRSGQRRPKKPRTRASFAPSIPRGSLQRSLANARTVEDVYAFTDAFRCEYALIRLRLIWSTVCRDLSRVRFVCVIHT